MLTQLSIRNYALIEDLQVSFQKGFTTITGETGAGKSILLDGLSMVLGKRADLSALKDGAGKCVIEAHFDIRQFNLKALFEELDLDYEDHSILRREILPSGKSRAFVNDVPVTLDIMSALGEKLIDIHSQHQTLQLTGRGFQLKVLDALASNQNILADYRGVLSSYKDALRRLAGLKNKQQEANREQDYKTFLLEELREAKLQPGMQQDLEEEHETLDNMETILESLSEGESLIADENIGLSARLRELKASLSRLAPFGKQYEELLQRVQSVIIEMDDLGAELSQVGEGLEADPQRLQVVSEKLQLLFDLQKKHGAADVDELIRMRDTLEIELQETLDLEEEINREEARVKALEEELQGLAVQLHDRRKKTLPELKTQLEERLRPLGMPNASFEPRLTTLDEFREDGKDDFLLAFSANKGVSSGELKKVASGGELSRIMLAIKSILAEYEPLPTMMFDEIDTGVSGEVSGKMGALMAAMSKHMQIFSITHLPQVASKGEQQYKVYKVDEEGRTRTHMKLLQAEERVVELAEMLGGKELTDSAMAHARQLLN